MNKVELVGRLTRDPESRQAGETFVTRFGIAVNRRFKNKNGEYEADFINCSAFGKTGEFIMNYFHKGSAIGLIGRIQTGSYEKNGQKVYTFDVVVDEVEFVESKKSAESNNSSGSYYNSAPQEDTSDSDDDFMNIPEEDDEVIFPFS